MPFASLGLAPELVRAVVTEGYTEPTPVQQEAIPLALDGRDLIGSAQTGTGKTAAFLLPILQRPKVDDGHRLRALVLVPTRELCEQVYAAAQVYGRFSKLRSTPVYGGVGLEPQRQAIRSGVDLVIATPGRLLDHVRRRNIDLSGIEVLVLDEADRMLDMGFAPDVRRILEELPSERQTMLFSATISADVDRLAYEAMRGHASVEIGRRGELADGAEHIVVATDKARKRQVLAEILRVRPAGARALVFCRTKHGVDKLDRHLRQEGLAAAGLHGGKAQSVRTRTLLKFREGSVDVLVATDVAARGIDVDGIAAVVNYDVPQDPEVYVHRMGRTARAGAKGLAITLMSPDEWLMMRDIEKLVGRVFTREVMEGFEPSVAPIQPSKVKVAKDQAPRNTLRGRVRMRRR